MPQIFQQGQVNLASLSVDDVYVIVTPPTVSVIRGVPTDVVGFVGTASWGPVADAGGDNVSRVVTIGSIEEVIPNLGFIRDDVRDLSTAVAVASLAGARNFRCVRVDDGTSTAATSSIVDTDTNSLVDMTARYTGTLGNSIIAEVGTGSAASTSKVTLYIDGVPGTKEVYDNLPNTADDFKAAFLEAIEFGQGAMRPPSRLLDPSNCSASAGTEAPRNTVSDATKLRFINGTDGASGVTDAMLIGDPTQPVGMYALDGQGVSQFCLAGHTTSANWGTILNFAKQIGAVGITGFAAGTDTDTAISAKNSAGIDSPWIAPMKDYVLWEDPTNKIRRLLPPEILAAGLFSSLSPEQGVGNKPVSGIIGTERTRDMIPYTYAEISKLTNAGINFFTNPIPYGNVFGLRHSQNASSAVETSGVNYTRMTNFLAASIAQALGKFVGRVQSSRPDDQTRADARATLLAFFNKLKQPAAFSTVGMIDDFTVQCDERNNTPQTVGEGILRADVACRYLAVVRFFLVNILAGQTVVTVSETPPAGFVS